MEDSTAPEETIPTADQQLVRPLSVKTAYRSGFDWETIFGILAGASGLGIVLVYELMHLSGYVYGQAVYAVDAYDEGVYLATASLMAHGYALYAQIYSAQPPGLPEALSLAVSLGGSPVTAGRVALLVFGIATLVAVGWIGLMSRNLLSAGFAVLLLGIAPEFLVYAHAIEEEVPMMALSALALAAAMTWLRTRTLEMAGLSGLFFGLAVLTKFFAFAMLLPLLVVIALAIWDGRAMLQGPKDRPRLLGGQLVGPVIVFVGVGLLPFLISLAIWRGAEWKEMVSDRILASGQSQGLGASSNLHQILAFAGTDTGLFLLALFGGLGLLIVAPRAGLVLGSWGLATLAILSVYHPLMGHHPVILLAPTAALAGTSLAELPNLVRRIRTPTFRREAGRQSLFSPRNRSLVSVAMIGVGGLLMVTFLPKQADSYAPLLIANGNDQYSVALDRAARIVQRVSPPGQVVAAGDPWVCVRAHRLCVPDLVDTSYVRIATGKLTAAQAIQATSRLDARTVVLGRGLCQVPRVGTESGPMTAYVLWVLRHYRMVAAMPNLQGSCGHAGVYVAR